MTTAHRTEQQKQNRTRARLAWQAGLAKPQTERQTMSIASPKRAEPSATPEFILYFRDKYGQALEQAVTSAEHTATAGWQRLYSGHSALIRDTRRDLAKQLKALAIALEDSGLTEDGEKELGEIKKASAQLRDDEEAFISQAIGPVREPVMTCDRVRQEALNEARRDEAESPLTHVGRLEAMQAEIAGCRKPRWNQETGCVVIDDPDGIGE